MNIDIDRDDLVRIRAMIMSLASTLSEVLTDGLPAPPKRCRRKQDLIDAMSAYEEWHESRWYFVREAEEFLKETEGWT